MSDEKAVTEREAVMREREAFVAGMASEFMNAIDGEPWNHAQPAENRERIRRERAATRFPLPKLTRPRVVKDPTIERVEWKCEDQRLYWRLGFSGWYDTESGFERAPGANAERVKFWADLLATPDEEYEP